MKSENLNIKPYHWEVIEAILKKNVSNDILVFFFGSRVAKNSKPYADLDILLQHKNNKSIPLKTMASLKADFIDSDLPWKVDIIDYQSISGIFKKNVDDTKITFI